MGVVFWFCPFGVLCISCVCIGVTFLSLVEVFIFDLVEDLVYATNLEFFPSSMPII